MKQVLTLAFCLLVLCTCFAQVERVDEKVHVDNIIFEKVEVPPQFPGGIQGWAKFLEKNLDPTVAVKNGAPEGKHVVTIRFIVNRDGSLSDIKIMSHPGFGTDKAVLDLMAKSPKWEPAKQNGHIVRAYKKQIITFIVEED